MSEASSPTATLDPHAMALRGRIGAYRLHATHDPKETTGKAREAFLGRFLREVDPDSVLADDERVRRAEYARKAYFARLAYARWHPATGEVDDTPQTSARSAGRS